MDIAEMSRCPGLRMMFLSPNTSIKGQLMTPHIQYSFAPAQTDPSIIRCKTCRVSLPNNAWKNCENCRRKNAEISRRHRKSAELRKLRGITFSLQTGTMNLSESRSFCAKIKRNSKPRTTFAITVPNCRFQYILAASDSYISP